jgi:hypothetical protein
VHAVNAMTLAMVVDTGKRNRFFGDLANGQALDQKQKGACCGTRP